MSTDSVEDGLTGPYFIHISKRCLQRTVDMSALTVKRLKVTEHVHFACLWTLSFSLSKGRWLPYSE